EEIQHHIPLPQPIGQLVAQEVPRQRTPRCCLGALCGPYREFHRVRPILMGAVLENCSVTRLRTLLNRTVQTKAFRIRSASRKLTGEASVKVSVQGSCDARMKAMNCRALRTVEVTEWLVARKSWVTASSWPASSLRPGTPISLIAIPRGSGCESR